MRVLVVNAGSTSVKLRVVESDDRVVEARDLGPVDDRLDDHLSDFLSIAGGVDATAHRVVHGGASFSSAVVVDAETRSALGELVELAPLHNPPALAGIDAVARLIPGIPSVACFDTAFHVGIPAAAATYALPYEWTDRWSLRRFGFHGLSCAYASVRASQLLDRPADGIRLTICHLGGGASVTAVAGGRSVDTTMGFTPLEGLVMATRPGDVDPGALMWVLSRGIPVSVVSDSLEHEGGLLALTRGRTGEMRELLDLRATGDEDAVLAIAVYLHRLCAKVASMAAATGGLDALVFTGGVGEGSPAIRTEACRRLEWIGVRLDEGANAAVSGDDRDISATGATVRVLVVHSREELEIAAQCRRVLSAGT